MRDSDFHFPSQKTHLGPKNLILLGLSGAGKTLIGRSLAQQTGFGLLDLDSTIEESQKKKIAELFAENGATYFRDLESRCLAAMTNLRNHVLVLGGGTLQRDENFQIAKQLGLLIWVDTPLSAIAWRLSHNPSELKKRPLLSDLSNEGDSQQLYTSLLKRLDGILEERVARYRESSVVFSDSCSAPEICAQRIVHLIGRHLSGKKS